MNEVLEFLNECGVFSISTVEGNQPRVRPFSFVMEYDGKLCFATSNKKPIYAQLIANPNTEITTATKDGKWIRVSGKAVFCTSKESQTQALEVMPILKRLYSVDDGIFEVFYLENAVANIYSMKGESMTIYL